MSSVRGFTSSVVYSIGVYVVNVDFIESFNVLMLCHRTTPLVDGTRDDLLDAELLRVQK